MSEEITSQVLEQTSKNIQKLFDLSTRIDERVKTIQERQEALDERIEKVVQKNSELMQKIAVLESKQGEFGLDEFKKEIVVIDKRLASVEDASDQTQARWNRLLTFIIQLVWVILAAWMLLKLNLQAPDIP